MKTQRQNSCHVCHRWFLKLSTTNCYDKPRDMDGDTIIMNPTDGRHVKIVEEQLLQKEQQFVSHPQDESRESRYTSFHRRSRIRSEVDITPNGCGVAADSSAVGDVLPPDNENCGITGYLVGFVGNFFYCLFQVCILMLLYCQHSISWMDYTEKSLKLDETFQVFL